MNDRDKLTAMFERVADILISLQNAGLDDPSVELHLNGRGTLWLGRSCTSEQLDLARKLLPKSPKPSFTLRSDLQEGLVFKI